MKEKYDYLMAGVLFLLFDQTLEVKLYNDSSHKLLTSSTITAANHSATCNIAETHLLTNLLPLIEFLRLDKALDRQMVLAGSQVLAKGHDVDIALATVFHGLEDLPSHHTQAPTSSRVSPRPNMMDVFVSSWGLCFLASSRTWSDWR